MSVDSESDFLRRLTRMNEYRFERFIADLWQRQGWKTTVTNGSNDRGVDVVAEMNTPFPQKQLIQVKRYASENKVGSPEIQQYSSLRHQEPGIDAVVIVTTSSFTTQAVDMADRLNVKLINGSGLYRTVVDTGAQDLVEKYAPSSKPQRTGEQPRASSVDVSEGIEKPELGKEHVRLEPLSTGGKRERVESSSTEGKREKVELPRAVHYNFGWKLTLVAAVLWPTTFFSIRMGPTSDFYFYLFYIHISILFVVSALCISYDIAILDNEKETKDSFNSTWIFWSIVTSILVFFLNFLYVYYRVWTRSRRYKPAPRSD